MAEEIRITIDEFRDVLFQKLIKHGAFEEEAKKTSEIFAINAADGVISHSILRVWRLLSHYDCGLVVPGRMPVFVSGTGAVARYDGNGTSGVLSASFCMEKACELADRFGIGMVALRNANHWMRGGYYGHLAADKGKVAICWTNTRANLPSWGSMVSNIGNNPFVMAVPGKDGRHLVLDSAMSQFSNGKLEVMRRAGKLLPVDGGYDEEGKLTRVPGDIEKTRRPIPMGFWKGSSMSILLDACAAILSDGLNTASIERKMQKDGTDEAYLCQIFIAIAPEALGESRLEEIEASILDSVHNAQPVKEGYPSRCPGERVFRDREAALKDGIMVPAESWKQILEL